MAIDLFNGIMHHLNILNVLNVSNNDEKAKSQGVNSSLICMKSRFGIKFTSIATPMK